MSYDIRLVDPITKEPIELPNPHGITGGTYILGGTRQAWLNITYNYYPQFKKVFGERGIRAIYGLTGLDSLPILRAAVAMLGDDVDEDYWKATEGNAKEALFGLMALAERCLDGVWEGD